MKTWIVDDSNQGDFKTVAEAIDAASAGDTIDITGGFDGVHNESDILVDKDLTITSSRYATIDAQGEGRIFTIDDGNDENQLDVTVKNMVLTGGNADDGTVERTDANLGGAIFNKEDLSIEKIKATDNFAVFGGGVIYNTGGQIEITKSVFHQNSTGSFDNLGDPINKRDGRGGAIYNTKGSIDIKESTFSDNTSTLFGGAIYVQTDGVLTMEQSSISNNFARNAGGGIFNSQSQITLTEVSINENESYFGGGIHNQVEGSEMTLVRSNLSNNRALVGGAGLYQVAEAQFTAIETSIQGNKIVSEIPGRDFGTLSSAGFIGGGAGVYISSGSGTLINSNVSNNQASIGAGMYIGDGGTLELQNSQVSNNMSVLAEIFDVIDPNIIEFPDSEFKFAGDTEPVNLTGTPENTTFVGGEGNDTLNGGAGVNMLKGNSVRGYLAVEDTIKDSNTFVLSTEAEATLIADFIDGQDVIGLKGGISFDDLTFSGNVINLNDQPIAFVNNVDTTLLTSEDFVTV